MNLRCWLLGHRWARHVVGIVAEHGAFSRAGDAWVCLNGLCGEVRPASPQPPSSR